MNTHVYLPDGLGQRAREAKLNLSGLLRAAVERELGEAPETPASRVTVRRVGARIEIRVSLPLDVLRGVLRDRD